VPQDPNDEPASVLLERIRAEREKLVAEGKLKRSKTTTDNRHYENVPFEIPESWEWTRVGEVSDTCLGKMLDKQKNQGTNQFYLRNINVRWEGFELTDLLQMPFEANENERYSINYGDLVVCEGGEPGRCAVWDKQESIKFQKALHRVRCHRGIINHYIQYVLKYLSTNGLLDDYFTGSTIKHLTGKALNSVLIPLPPTSEQIRIVSVLKKWITLLEDLEIIKNDLQETIKRTKNKVLSLAISGKLVQQDSNDEPSIELLKRINPNYVPCCDTSHYGNLPLSWCVCLLGDIVKVINGRNQSKVVNPNGQYPIYGSGGIMGYADDYLCPENCTIIGRKGTINNPILVETKFWNVDTAFGICPSECIDYLYLYYFCKSFNFNKLDKSTTLPSLTKTNIEQIHIPLPPLAEQKRIVAKVTKLLNLLDKITAEL
jgi:type I restriction enzyme S subunit